MQLEQGEGDARDLKVVQLTRLQAETDRRRIVVGGPYLIERDCEKVSKAHEVRPVLASSPPDQWLLNEIEIHQECS